MKRILAIGGAVIKTGMGPEIIDRLDDVEMIMFNGGAIFHDFQLALEGYTSVPIVELLKSHDKLESSSLYLWKWIEGKFKAPEGSLVRACEDRKIPVLLFTALACDYWMMFDDRWNLIAMKSKDDFVALRDRVTDRPFHYVNMGSAVIHPEVFLKSITGVEHDFRADVVDFLDMYRPRTRVAVYGDYYQMTFSDYMNNIWRRNDT